MTEAIAFKPSPSVTDFRPDVGNRPAALTWNAQQLIGARGSLTLGETRFSTVDLMHLGAGHRLSPALQNKVDAVGGRDKLYAVLDDLLAGAKNGKLSLDGKTDRHVLIPQDVANATSGDFQVRVTSVAKPKVSAPPPPPPAAATRSTLSLSQMYKWAGGAGAPAPRKEPLPGVSKGARPDLGTVGDLAPAEWHHVPPLGDVPVGGSVAEQARQVAMEGVLVTALGSLSLGGAIKLPREVTDPELRILGTTPPIGSNVAHAEYNSRIIGIPPEQAFASAVKDLGGLFGMAGVSIMPTPAFDLADPSNRTQFKMRFAIVQPPPAAVVAPVELVVDLQKLRFDAVTLDGHPLRGLNHWEFQSDSAGGTIVHQTADFQMSSLLSEQVQKHFMPTAQGDTWRAFHSAITAAAGFDASHMKRP